MQTDRTPFDDALAYSAITDRPAFTWPGGKRIAFYTAINIEQSSPRGGHGHTLTRLREGYDSRNHAWREYGMRVGLWQLLALFDEQGLLPGFLVNAAVLDAYPRVAQELRRRPGEIIAHGRSNVEIQTEMSTTDEARMVHEVRQRLSGYFERPVSGWLSPWIAQSEHTPDLLKASGYTYQLDWPIDDQPVALATRHGRLWSVPYSVEINDTPTMCVRHHTHLDYLALFRSQLACCLRLAERWPIVLSLPLHPFVVGQPFRLEALREICALLAEQAQQIWFCQPRDIVNHMNEVTPDGYPTAVRP